MSEPRTFTALMLDNANSGENISWLTASSQMVFTIVSGSVLVTDETDGASLTIIQMADTDPEKHKILDFHQGARLKATAQGNGTTFRVSKHEWQAL